MSVSSPAFSPAARSTCGFLRSTKRKAAAAFWRAAATAHFIISCK